MSPARLLVQRLDQRGRLSRFPPVALGVRGDVVVLLLSPRAASSELSDLLYHAVARPPLDKIPELRRSTTRPTLLDQVGVGPNYRRGVGVG
jgi:hypothetical protein